MRNLIFALTVGALLGGIPALSGHGQEPKKDPPKKGEAKKPDPQKVRELMRRKLEHSQRVLEAITMNDFEKLAKNAEGLLEVSKQVEFKVVPTEQYELYRDEFRRNAEAMAKQAKEKNPDAASLTYLEMTLNCFHCHRYVRDVGQARLDPDARP
jgi:hypothetical protein